MLMNHKTMGKFRTTCKHVTRLSILSSLIATSISLKAQEQVAAEDGVDVNEDIEKIAVLGQRTNRYSNGATNLNLSIKDTPQSISIVGSEQMEQFGVNNLNDALRLATGIQVEETSTNLTQFLSRGFEIKNTQIDGVGLPNGWGVVTNAMDAFGYEKVEVIRGANGLLTGVGNASGTINYVRKRPTNEAQGQFGVSVGSWNNRRVELDYSTPFTENGTWAGRVVMAKEDSDSYLRDFESGRTYVYAVVDGQLGENGTLAVGYSNQQSDTSGNMWGQLTFVSTEGAQLEWDVSASTTQDWTYWNSNTENAFVDYTHFIGNDWQLTTSYNYRKYDHDAQLFMGYSVTGIDAETGEGLVGWAYKSPYETKMQLADVTVNGEFELFGEYQEVLFGMSIASSDSTDWYYPTDYSGAAFGALPGFPYEGDAIAEPTWSERTVYTAMDQSLKRFFGATHLTLTEKLKVLLGFNWAEYKRDGVDAEANPFDQTETNLSPYAGITYAFTDNIVGYANYSDIYQPQEEVAIDESFIDPSKGVNYEVGVKADWLDGKLLTTLAWYSAEQKGLATYGGTVFLDDRAFGYYTGVDIESEGFEFEVTGKIGEHTEIVFGFTDTKMGGQDGGNTYPWVPRRLANLLVSTRLPQYSDISFGLSGRWQSETSNSDLYTGYLVKQESYAIVNAFAAWDILPNLTVRANINNITDEKFINSLYVASYYGKPRNYLVSIDWRF